MIIYFLFSSITFLQLYIPLVIELRKRNNYNKIYTPYFIVRSNYKDYANPFSETNYPILLKYAKKYNIILIDSRKINIKSIQGLVCLLYTSDAADDSLRVDLGGRRIIKK